MQNLLAILVSRPGDSIPVGLSGRLSLIHNEVSHLIKVKLGLQSLNRSYSERFLDLTRQMEEKDQEVKHLVIQLSEQSCAHENAVRVLQDELKAATVHNGGMKREIDGLKEQLERLRLKGVANEAYLRALLEESITRGLAK
ncbi:MAG TPA: hypothetical protein VJZ52_01165 [Candidatus Paceibacterota bacterium]|nr:hypothetical protein [Candidatus Paceibacterota bacterium]